MKTLAIFFVCIALAFSAPPTGQSSCNAGTCAAQADCDVGLCCDKKCVAAATSVLAKDATCDAMNFCARCADGQYCLSGKCTDFPKVVCKGNYKCPCDSGANCTSGVCASDKVCRSNSLSGGDPCVDNSQCSSQKCMAGSCVSSQVNETCSPFTEAFFPVCAVGLYCDSVSSTCQEGSKIGDKNNCTEVPCAQYRAFCSVAGTCVEAFSVADGGDCADNSVDQCKFGAKCEMGKCVRPTGLCNYLSCVAGVSYCGCTSDNKATECLPLYNECETERVAFVKCARDNGCKPGAFTFNLLDPQICTFRKCEKEVIAYSCCQGCRADSTVYIGSNLVGLDCGAKKYTVPTECEPQCGTPSTCPDTTPVTTGAASSQSESDSDSESNTQASSQSNAGTTTMKATTTGVTRDAVTTAAAVASAASVAINVLLIAIVAIALF